MLTLEQEAPEKEQALFSSEMCVWNDNKYKFKKSMNSKKHTRPSPLNRLVGQWRILPGWQTAQHSLPPVHRGNKKVATAVAQNLFLNQFDVGCEEAELVIL